MPPQVLRATAEATLRSQLCEPKDLNADIPGQWWLPPWGGPKFFLQWSKADPKFVDEQHLRCILEDLARYRPLNNAGH